MSKATFVKQVDGMRGNAQLFSLVPPLNGHQYVVVSAVIVPFGQGPETYIFPANKDGEIIDWSEQEGSYKGGLDHHKALSNAGYEI